jgi:hypothetical protein
MNRSSVGRSDAVITPRKGLLHTSPVAANVGSTTRPPPVPEAQSTADPEIQGKQSVHAVSIRTRSGLQIRTRYLRGVTKSDAHSL